MKFKLFVCQVEKLAKIRKWTSKEINGLIFVWYHAENEEPWELPIYKLDSYYGLNEFIVHSHIQDIPENGADVAHLSTVHGTSITAGNDIRKMRSSWLSFGTHIWDAQ